METTLDKTITRDMDQTKLNTENEKNETPSTIYLFFTVLMHSWFVLGSWRHHDGCRCPGNSLSPGNQQPLCWLVCDYHALWIVSYYICISRISPTTRLKMQNKLSSSSTKINFNNLYHQCWEWQRMQIYFHVPYNELTMAGVNISFQQWYSMNTYSGQVFCSIFYVENLIMSITNKLITMPKLCFNHNMLHGPIFRREMHTIKVLVS